MKKYCVLICMFLMYSMQAYHASVVLDDDPILQPNLYHLISLDQEIFLVHMLLDESQKSSYRVYNFLSTIIKSGFYRLASGVTGTITIAVSDVMLDCSGNVVTGGIIINSNLKNITIKRGTIIATGSDGVLINSGCSTIALYDIAVQNATRGISFSNVTDSIIERCEMSYNTTGLLLNTSSNILVKNCDATRNTQTGFSLNLSTTCALLNCKALSTGDGNTSVINNNVYGFISQNGFGNIFDRCTANSTQALSTTDYNSIVAGFALTGTEQFSRITNSTASNAATSSSGITVPYGIYLQGTISSPYTVTATPLVPAVIGVSQGKCDWSLDGRYLALSDSTARFVVYQLDRVANVLSRVATPNVSPPQAVQGLRWSPNGYFLAVLGGPVQRPSVYVFSPINNTLTLVAQPDIAAGGGQDIAWSRDQQFIAIGTSGFPFLQIYQFNSVSSQLKLFLSSSVPIATVGSVDWSPDGLYLATADSDTTASFNVYSFNAGNVSLTKVALLSPGGIGIRARWSTSGKYLAVGRDVTVANNNIEVYSFNRSTNTLTLVAIPDVNPSLANINGISWSSDDRYLFIGFTISPFILLYRFDPDFGRLTRTAVPNFNPGASVSCTAWSPDGGYLIASTSGANGTFAYAGLSFPSNNVIKNNSASCNSGGGGGAGISGSSIANLIIQNTAYENPRNPTVVFTNYQFVCNVFNQLFGIGPTYLQNKEVNHLVLQSTDVDTTLKIIESKVQIIQQQVTSLLVFA